MKTPFQLIFFVFISVQFTWAQQRQFDNTVTPTEHTHNQKSSLIENKGQWPEPVLFQSPMEGGKVWVQQNKFVYHLQDFSSMHENHMNFENSTGRTDIREEVVHLNFHGSNKVSEVLKSEQSTFYYNYFKGNDRSKWARKAYSYGNATLKNLYDGIDLRILNNNGLFKYEFIVAPNQSFNKIKLNYAGQESVVINEAGDVEITTKLGKIFEEHPYAYQIIKGKKTEITCSFSLTGDNVSFNIGEYNPNYPLVIDPVLVFATYDGANSDNFGMTATYGYDGSAYSGGTVYGNDYPTPSPTAYDINSNFTVFNGAYGITDVFVSKYSADGTTMIWGTFLGGGNNNAGTETAHSMICDLNDNIYLFGATSSADFPTSAGAYDGVHNGGTAGAEFTYNGVFHSTQGVDLYVAKLSSDGSTLMGSSFVGGNGNDGINYNAGFLPYNNVGAYNGLISNYGDQFRGEIMLDSINNVIVASCTKSNNFPTVNAFQNSNAGGQDGVVFKLSADFTQLLFSSYYGGSQDDACYSVKVDLSGNFVFAGGTASNNLPGTAGGYQANNAGGVTDGFVVKIPPAGTSITQASYIGMNQYDQVFFVEVDRVNNIFLLGQSVGGNFPIQNAAYSNGASSNFIIKLDPTLTTNLASTRFGNGSTAIHISPAAFLVDNCGNIYVSGWGANILQATPLNGMPVTPDAFQLNPPNGFDFYLMVLQADLSGILYGSYIGGPVSDEHVDGGTSRFDKNGIVYQSVCGGCGGNSDFPTSPGAWSANNNSSNCNNLIYKFDSGLLPLADFTVDQTIGCTEFTVTFENNSSANDSYLWDFGDGELDSTTFNPVVTYTDPGSYVVFLYVTDSICQLTDTAQITVFVVDSVIAEVVSPVNLCNNNPYDLSVNTYGTAFNFIWSIYPDFSIPLNAPGDSVVTITSSGTYYIQVSNAFCTTDDSVVVLFDAPPVADFNLLDSIGCAPLSVSFNNISVQTSYFLWDFGNGEVDSTNFEPTINYTNVGTYDVSLYIYDSICAFSDTAYATVTIVPDVTVVSLDSILVCNQPDTSLMANSNGTATTFIWSSLPDFSNVLNPGNDSTIVVSTAGMYYVQVSNGFCTTEDSVYVDFSIAPLADFTIDNAQGCTPVTVNFTNNSVPNSGFLWDFGNGTQDSLNFNTTVTFDVVGTFQVVLFIYDDVCAVFDTDTAQVTVTPEPTLDLVDTVELCVAVITTLSPVTTGATQFVWSTNNMFSDTLNSPITDPNVTIDTPVAGYYYIEASNGDCFVIDSVVFVFIEPELSMSAEDSICVGDITEVTVTNLNPTISLTYDWQPTGVLINPGNVSSVFANPTFSQYIYITGTSLEGCLVSDSIFINVSDIDSTMVIASASDYTVAPGTTVTLFGSPSGLSSYQWIPDTGLSAPTNQQTDAVIDEDIIYTLTVSDGICTRDDTVEIKVYEIICEDPYVFVPNAFSPNGDGYNDVLYVRGLYIEKVIFRIYDRWGELVFESNDVTIGWDGVFRDRQLQPDVYDYYLDVTCVGGLKSIVKGNITLMR